MEVMGFLRACLGNCQLKEVYDANDYGVSKLGGTIEWDKTKP